MSFSDHHVSLNGVFYKLYEDGQGEHYQQRGEPLRPPNSVVVQGEGRQDLFQTRTDLILWSITDWSGGEGQIKFSAQNADRHAVLYNVDPFTQPGQLRPGPHFEETNDSVDATWDDDQVVLVPNGASGELWAVDYANTSVTLYKWDDTNERWGAGAAIPTIAGALTRDGVDADDQYLFMYDSTNGHLYKYDGTTTTKMNSTALTNKDDVTIRELGDYVYLIRPKEFKVWEIVKTATGSTAFTEVDNGPKSLGNDALDQAWQVAKGPNRLFIMLTQLDGATTIREITPTTAAGAGFGKEIAYIPGFHGTSLWYANGMILMSGWAAGEKQNDRVLLYLIPGGDYGTLGKVRAPYFEDIDARAIGRDDGVDLLTTQAAVWGTAINPRVYRIDTVGGGMAQLGEIGQSGIEVGPPVMWKGQVFVASKDATTKRIYRGRDFTTGTSYADSPWHDLGLADEKLLASMELSTEPLPADWNVVVKYAVDGSDTFTTAGTYTTDGGTGTTFVISDGTTTKKFRTLKVRIEFAYTGVGIPTTAPIVNAVQVRGQVTKKQKVWGLILDLKEDLAGSSQRRRSEKKIDNIQTLGDTEDAFTFIDGYSSRERADTDTYSVVMDSYSIVLPRAGEGFAVVTLREVAK